MHEFAVTPVSESKSQVGPGRKFVPVRTTFKLVCPCAPKFGFAPVSVGAALGIPCCTVKPLVSVALWPSELVIMMLREPSVALARMLMVAVICVAEL